MAAPWSETQLRVVVEFKKSSEDCCRRCIQLTHQPAVLPPQLYGRVTPQAWMAFMHEVQALASLHPYTQAQSGGPCCLNLAGLVCFLCAGFGCFQADGGDYNAWLQRVIGCVERHRPALQPCGVIPSVQQVHGSYWIQLDIDPNMAVGVAVPYQAPVPAPPPGMPPAPGWPSPYPPQPAGYGQPGKMA